MKKILLSAMLALFVGTAFAQVERQGNVFVQTQTTNKQVSLKNETKTNYTYKDKDGKEYPIYLSKNGNAFVIRTSKNGNQYKKYLPEVTEELKTKK